MLRRLRICVLAALAGGLFATGTAEAAIEFTASSVPVSGGKPLDVAVGDLDGANGPDLIASVRTGPGTADGSLAVRLNEGDGTFAAETLYPLGCVANQVELTDLGATNGNNTPDGALDAVVFCIDTNGGRIGRIAGNGAGAFLGPATLPGALIAGVGDGLGIDGGFPRLALGDVRPPGSPVIPFWTYYYNAGTSGNPVYLSALCWTNDWVNLECSGAAYNPPQPNTYPPLVSGTVADARLFGTAQPQNHSTPSQVRRTDRLVAWGNFPGATPPPGTTLTGAERPFGASPGNQTPPWQSIAIGDLAGDGPDILTAEGVCGCVGSPPGTPAGKVSVLPGNFAQGIPPGITPTSFDSVPGVMSIGVADIDGDGKQDVIGTSHVNGASSVFVHRGDGANYLAPPETFGLSTSSYSRAPVTLADVDGDGKKDAVLITDAIQVLANGSTPGPPVEPPDPPDPPNPPQPPVDPGATADPLAGISGLKKSATSDKKGALKLGSATNPPTAGVSITVTIPKPKPRSVTPAKALLIGKADVSVPAGEERELKVRLKSKARKLLKRGNLKASVTLVAAAADGTEDTKTQSLKIKQARG